MLKQANQPTSSQIFTFMRIFLLLVFFASLVSGCATNNIPAAFSVDSLHTPIRMEEVTLVAPLTYSDPSGPPGDQIAGGLLAGRYVSEKEDSKGVFYRGVGRPYFQQGMKGVLTKERYAMFMGGFWIPKDPGLKPRLYFYVEAGYPSIANVADLSHAVAPRSPNDSEVISNLTIANVVAQPNMTPGQGAMAGAIGEAIVSAAIRTNVGKINFWLPIEDDAFSRKLIAIWRPAAEAK